VLATTDSVSSRNVWHDAGRAGAGGETSALVELQALRLDFKIDDPAEAVEVYGQFRERLERMRVCSPARDAISDAAGGRGVTACGG